MRNPARLLLFLPLFVFGGDWHAWRADAERSATTAKESGGSLHSLVKRLEGVKATDSILVELKAVKGETVIAGLEVLAE